MSKSAVATLPGRPRISAGCHTFSSWGSSLLSKSLNFKSATEPPILPRAHRLLFQLGSWSGVKSFGETKSLSSTKSISVDTARLSLRLPNSTRAVSFLINLRTCPRGTVAETKLTELCVFKLCCWKGRLPQYLQLIKGPAFGKWIFRSRLTLNDCLRCMLLHYMGQLVRQQSCSLSRFRPVFPCAEHDVLAQREGPSVDTPGKVRRRESEWTRTPL